MIARVFALLFAIILVVGTASAQVLAPGVEKLYFSAPGPNNVHVIKVNRAQADIEFQLGFPQARRNFTAKEGTSVIANRYEADPMTDVLAATNGAFFGSGNDVEGMMGSDGNFIQYPDLSKQREVIASTEAGGFVVARNITISRNWFVAADGGTIGIDIVNEDRLDNTLVLYTPDWGPTTGSTVQALEVVVQNASYPLRVGKRVTGVVTQVRTGAQSLNNAIPAGGFVLSARGTKATELQSKVQVGDRVGLQLDVSTSNFNNARTMLMGAGWLLLNGSANTSTWNYSSGFLGRNPRTVFAYNATHSFLVTIDGRSAGGSVGMSFDEMVTFLTGTLGATDAVNLDGGGSTTMWVNGSVVNVPSDGSERAVGNAVLVVRRLQGTTTALSDSFPPGGRQRPWDDKFYFNGVEAFDPPSPGGDGSVMVVRDPAGGFETTRLGARQDTDMLVQADVYCDYRPDDAANGFERYGIFARDNGNAAFTTNFYQGGNCYMMTFDSNNGRIRAGKTVDGTVTDFLNAAPRFVTASGWHNFRIICIDDLIAYLLDGNLLIAVTDSSLVNGYSGVGYHEQFSGNNLMRGARIDNFLMDPAPATPIMVQSWMLD